MIAFSHHGNKLIHKQALQLSSVRSHNWKVMPCSAVTGNKVSEAIDWIVNDVGDRVYYHA